MELDSVVQLPGFEIDVNSRNKGEGTERETAAVHSRATGTEILFLTFLFSLLG